MPVEAIFCLITMAKSFICVKKYNISVPKIFHGDMYAIRLYKIRKFLMLIFRIFYNISQPNLAIFSNFKMFFELYRFILSLGPGL